MTNALAIIRQVVSVLPSNVGLEDREQRRTHFTALQLLLALVLDPDLGLFDV